MGFSFRLQLLNVQNHSLLSALFRKRREYFFMTSIKALIDDFKLNQEGLGCVKWYYVGVYGKKYKLLK
jgi:hypothetical protein